MGTTCCKPSEVTPRFGETDGEGHNMLSASEGAEAEAEDVLNAADIYGAKTQELPFSETAEAEAGAALVDLAALQAKLQEVDSLIDQVLLYDAGLALRELDAAAERAALDTTSGNEEEQEAIRTLLERLRSDATLEALRSWLGRCTSALAAIAVPAQRKDVSWSRIELKYPTISPDFIVRCQVRYKTAEEWDPNGPYAQFCVRTEVHNWPLRLSRRVAIERETDQIGPIISPDMHAELIEGEPGTRSKLFSASLRVISKPRLSPWKFDNVELREFTCLKHPPLPGMTAAMLMMSCSPPDGANQFAGFDYKPCASKCKRLAGLKILRFLAPESKPERCREIIMAEGGVNIPSWLLPISLAARILGSVLASGLKFAAEETEKRWSELEFQGRMEKCPEFYGPVSACDGNT